MDPEAFVVTPDTRIRQGLLDTSPPLDRTTLSIFDRANVRLSTHPSNLLVMCDGCETAFDQLKLSFNIFLARSKNFLATGAAPQWDQATRGKDVANFHPGRETVVFHRLATSGVVSEDDDEELNEILRYRTCFPNPVSLTIHLINVLRRRNSRLVGDGGLSGQRIDGDIGLRSPTSDIIMPSIESLTLESHPTEDQGQHSRPPASSSNRKQNPGHHPLKPHQTHHDAVLIYSKLDPVIRPTLDLDLDPGPGNIFFSAILDKRRTVEALRLEPERVWLEEQEMALRLYWRGKEEMDIRIERCQGAGAGGVAYPYRSLTSHT